MQKLNRISAILIQLQSKRVVPAKEIADRFNVSLRTIYRDIRVLEQAGVPILSEAGVGYSLMKNYRLPPVQFSEDEALALVTASKILTAHTDFSTISAFNNALFKIKAVLNQDHKEKIASLEQKLLAVANPYFNPDQNLYLAEILQAIYHKNLLKITYASSKFDLPVSRQIEPVGVFSQYNKWYLIGFCRLRNDYRHFRVDRISDFAVEKERFDQKHPGLEVFLHKTKEEKHLTRVLIRLPKSSMHLLGNEPYFQGLVSETMVKDQVEMVFLTSSLPGFAHWMLIVGHVVDILEPKMLKSMVIDRLKTIENRFKE